jgi:hypothetical protein
VPGGATRDAIDPFESLPAQRRFQAPIGAPCTQRLRHGDPLSPPPSDGTRRLTTTAAAPPPSPQPAGKGAANARAEGEGRQAWWAQNMHHNRRWPSHAVTLSTFVLANTSAASAARRAAAPAAAAASARARARRADAAPPSALWRCACAWARLSSERARSDRACSCTAAACVASRAACAAAAPAAACCWAASASAASASAASCPARAAAASAAHHASVTNQSKHQHKNEAPWVVASQTCNHGRVMKTRRLSPALAVNAGGERSARRLNARLTHPPAAPAQRPAGTRSPPQTAPPAAPPPPLPAPPWPPSSRHDRPPLPAAPARLQQNGC